MTRRRRISAQRQAGVARGKRTVVLDGDNHGIISTGDNATNVLNVLPKPAITPMDQLSVPGRVMRLLGRPGLFVGRDHDMARLMRVMDSQVPVVVTALHGLGGVGKSSLAGHFAQRSSHLMVWSMIADSPAAIELGMAELATALQPELASVRTLDQLPAEAMRWLTSHQDWLLILDNVNNPADVAPLLGRISSGKVLITSRLATGWHGLAEPLSLDVLGPDESMELLVRIVNHGCKKADLSGAQGLCAELGGLPLAVEQAAAFMAETGISPGAYLELLASVPARMYGETAEGADESRTLARVWRVTLDHLGDQSIAVQVLRVLSWFAPDNIPRVLLAKLADQPVLLKAVGRLAAYSMIKVDGQTLGVHRLVQAIFRTPDSTDPHRAVVDIAAALGQATAAVADAMPRAQSNDPVAWPAYRMLMPHCEALAAHAPTDTDTNTTVRIFNGVGLFLSDQGNFALALAYLSRCVVSSERMLGSDDFSTLSIRQNLAAVYERIGELGKAISTSEAVLADCNRVLGADHPLTMNCRHGLAYAYMAGGDYGRAIPLFRSVLDNYEDTLGCEHALTLTVRHNLGNAYKSTGKLGRAIELHEAVLAARRCTLGDDHPETLTSRHSLADAVMSAGNLDQAISMLESLIADRARVLGPAHIETLNSRNQLAGAYVSSGDTSTAIDLYKAVLEVCEQNFDNDHPLGLATRNNLAAAYRSAGDFSLAISMFEELLDDCKRVLRDNHPHTLVTRMNLARVHLLAGRSDRAVLMYKAVFADCKRLLGAGHPIAEAARGGLALAIAHRSGPSHPG